MAKHPTPHDSFFKYFLAKPGIAADFLSHALPSEIVASLELSALELQNDTFVDETLQYHFTDLLYRVPTKNGHFAFIYLLFEHKSYPDPRVRFQLLGYMVRIWDKKLGGTNQFSPILPFLVYHGRTKWSISTRFIDLFEDLDKALVKYVPNFEHQLIDLSSLRDEQIRGHVWTRVFQLILKYIFDDTLPQRLPDILRLVDKLIEQESGLQMLAVILRYVSEAGQGITQENMDRAIDIVWPAQGAIINPSCELRKLRDSKVN